MKLQNSFVKKTSITTLAIVVAATATIFSTNSFAANTCKGLESSACDTSSSCRWVESYQRKDGRKVNAFCRSYSAKKNISKSRNDRQKSSAVVGKQVSAKTLSTKPAAKNK